jgi:hypothetical protein
VSREVTLCQQEVTLYQQDNFCVNRKKPDRALHLSLNRKIFFKEILPPSRKECNPSI